MSGPVLLVSAPWCKRCHELKPDIVALCAVTGRELRIVSFDDLEDDDPVKVAVKSLPTLLMDGKVYTAATIEAWKTDIVETVKLGGSDTEF